MSDKKEFDDYISKNRLSDNKKILIVDDLTYVVKTIERILSEQGYLIITAKTGYEALEKFEKYFPDLITLCFFFFKCKFRDKLSDFSYHSGITHS